MSESPKTESQAQEQEKRTSVSVESSSQPISESAATDSASAEGQPSDNRPGEENTDQYSYGSGDEGRSRQNAGMDTPFVSKWANFYDACAKIGPLYLLLFICCMVWPDYWQKGTGTFCPPEINSVTAYLHCIQESSWLAPTALENGSWSLPQWPLFYLFIGLLALIPGLAEANWLIPLACASSAAIAVIGAWFFTHAAGFGLRAAFASGLILLCAPIFAPLHHFFGPVTLATGLMLFSLAFFCRGWRAHRSWISLPLAFIFAALAGLCGGVLYIAIPLLGSLLFLLWQGKYKRGQSLDALTGFLLLLIIIGLWIGAVLVGKYPENYLRDLFQDSIRLSWPPQHYWYLALIAGALGLMPWLLSIFGVSWFRVLKDSVISMRESRHANGSALMWLALVLACCISLFVPHTPLAAITIGGLLAPLLGKAFVRLSPLGNRFFFFLASLFTILVGCLFLALHFETSQSLIFSMLPVQPPAVAGPELQSLTAVLVIGGICILAGLGGFFFVRRARGGGGMIYASLVTIVIGQIALFMVAPALYGNPKLPLKSLDAIAQEIEHVKASLPAPSPAPQPGQDQTAQPAAPQSPTEVQEQTLPSLTIPRQDDSSQAVTPSAPQEVPAPASPESAAPIQQEAPAPALPEPAAPIQQEEPVLQETLPSSDLPETPPAQQGAPLPEKQADPRQESEAPTSEDPAAGIPMTLPDAIEVPSGDAQTPAVQEPLPEQPESAPNNSGEGKPESVNTL